MDEIIQKVIPKKIPKEPKEPKPKEPDFKGQPNGYISDSIKGN